MADSPERVAYYQELARLETGALWTVANKIEPWAPRSASVPVVWRYQDLRGHVLRSAELVSPEEAGRRVIYLNNPGRRDVAAAVGWLYSGLQVMKPGELASAHAHSHSALRFIMEGSGAYTIVDGHKMTLGANDFVLTQRHLARARRVRGRHHRIWQDGLDIPLVNALEAGFYAVHPDLNQAVTYPVDDTTATWGGVALRPQASGWTKPYSPLFKYEWGVHLRGAAPLRARVTAGSPYDGVLLEYVNPMTGGPVMPTIGASMQLLRPASTPSAPPHRQLHLPGGQGQRLFHHRGPALRLDRARHLLRAVLGHARARQPVLERRRLPVLFQRSAGHARAVAVPRRGAQGQRRSSDADLTRFRTTIFHPTPRPAGTPVSTRLEYSGVPMRLVTFSRPSAAAGRLGALADGYVIDLALLGQRRRRCPTTC